MKRALIWHSRYLSLVPPPRAIVGSLRPVAIKYERIVTGPIARATFDVILRDDRGYWPVLLAEHNTTHMYFSSAYRAYGFELTALAERLEPIVEAQPVPEEPIIRIFEDDAFLEAAADDARSLVPGIIPFNRLVDAADRWRVLAPLCAGRDVIDASTEIGYGPHIVSPFATSVTQGAGDNRGDIVVALLLEPADVGTTAVQLRARLRDGGILVLHSAGAQGEAALREAGLEPRRFVRPAGHVLPVPEEWFAYDPPGVIPVRPQAVRSPIAVAERPLRVLFSLRSSAKAIFGGDVVQVEQTASELRRFGHDVVVSTESTIVPDGFDIVHLTNLTVPPETLGQARCVERFEGPIVMMPIFTDHADETVWGMRVTPQVFAQANDDVALAEMLDHMAARGIQISIPHHGGMIGPPARLEMIEHYTAMQVEICKRVDFMVANAHSEMHRVYRYIDSSIPYAVAPSAADPALYRPEAAAAFRERFKLGDYVLVTGRFEGRKNQLLLAHALRDSGKTLVMIGRGYELGIGNIVRAWLPGNVIIFNEMPEAQLAGAIAAARVVALPSWDEVVSLSSLNAAACGTSIVLTRNSYEHEYIRDDAEYCDPGDWKSIAAAVERAWASHDLLAERRAELSERVRREYTWEQAARRTQDAYYRVLAHNPRGEARRVRYGN